MITLPVDLEQYRMVVLDWEPASLLPLESWLWGVNAKWNLANSSTMAELLLLGIKSYLHFHSVSLSYTLFMLFPLCKQLVPSQQEANKNVSTRSPATVSKDTAIASQTATDSRSSYAIALVKYLYTVEERLTSNCRGIGNKFDMSCL
jgi:hypothetical protein